MSICNYSEGWTTKRLHIRAYRGSDYSVWRQGHLLRLSKQNKFDPGRVTREKLMSTVFKQKLNTYREMAKKDQLYNYGIFLRKTGVHLGSVDLYLIVRPDLHWANLGYQIHNQYWGKGYATEAARAALRIGFKKLSLHRIEAATELNHKAAIRVAESIGMRKEGVRKKFFPSGSRWLDLVIFAVTK